MLTIGKLGEATGVKVPTIRYYEINGLLPAAVRTDTNRRTYDEATVRRLETEATRLRNQVTRLDAAVGDLESDARYLATGRATLLENCEVRRILGTQCQVTEVEASIGGEVLILRSSRIVIAAGALSTPRLLLNSASEAWPNGCGNAGGHVGRNLMLHLNEVFAVWPGKSWSGSTSAPAKAIGLRDLMMVNGQRLGMVQALGVDARQSEILTAIRERLGDGRFGHSRIVREGARIPAKITSAVLGTAKLFVGLLEDFPDPFNRVIVDPARPSSIVAEYRVPHELQLRRRLFRGAIKRAFKGMRPMFLNRDAQPNWGHPCGTARMGLTPATSVVDRNCRVHGIGNLWIADAA